MTNVAVIGVGSMGRNHARVFSELEGVLLKAVVDRDIDLARTVATRYRTNAYCEYQEIFSSEEVDAVSIAVPSQFHKECAIFAMDRGKHVLVEKPIATDEMEALDILRCAELNGVKLMVGHIERFNPAVIELKRRLEKGEVGEIYKIDVQRIGPFPPRVTDMGVVVDLSVHDIDIISY